MSWQFLFTPRAEKDLKLISKPVAKQIAKKLLYFAKQEDPLKYAKKLKAPLKGFRFRVGQYRIIFDVKDQKIKILIILRIAHRKDIYR